MMLKLEILFSFFGLLSLSGAIQFNCWLTSCRMFHFCSSVSICDNDCHFFAMQGSICQLYLNSFLRMVYFHLFYLEIEMEFGYQDQVWHFEVTNIFCLIYLLLDRSTFINVEQIRNLFFVTNMFCQCRKGTLNALFGH